MRPSSVGASLASLHQGSTDAELARIAVALAGACRERNQPRKSLALYLRNAARLAPREILDSLSRQVIDLLDQAVTEPAAIAPTVAAPWIDVSEAAAALRTQRKTLLERVKLVRYRHLYGWPFWDGHQWRFSAAALDPATHAAHMATLCSREPTAHVAMLPDWCERQSSD